MTSRSRIINRMRGGLAPPGSSSGLQTFSTDFSTIENPVSIGGKMITSNSPGVSWIVLTPGTPPVAVVADGAENTQYNVTGLNDALAVCTGTWRPDQQASVTIGSLVPFNLGSFGIEVEIHLRTDPVTGVGYEITWGFSRKYWLIARWLSNGSFDEILPETASPYQLLPGDVVSASMVGSTITMYTNGVQVQQITDTMFTTGNPGFGFNAGSNGTDPFAFRAFSAQELD